MKIKELIESWGFSPSVVSRIIRATSLEELPAPVRPFAESRERECFHAPGWDDVQAHALNGYLKTFGVESLELQDSDGDPVRVEYLNAGDTYAATLCRIGFPSARRPFEICSFGPWHVESCGYYAEKFEPQIA
jgi:hypothetical protein